MRTIELVCVGRELDLLIGGDPIANRNGVVRAIIQDTSQPTPNVVWSAFGTGAARQSRGPPVRSFSEFQPTEMLFAYYTSLRSNSRRVCLSFPTASSRHTDGLA